MGTTYTLKYMPVTDGPSKEEVEQAVDTELAEVNAQMSTYIASSELSQFNNSSSTEWFEVSPDLVQVIEQAQKLSATTGGAFDVTVGPLVDLWGFGPSRSRDSVPSEHEISDALQLCGIEHLSTRPMPPAIKKAIPSLRVDLSAIAKGHGVDRVAAELERMGIRSYFIEIGGEIRAAGAKTHDSPWRAGVEKPIEDGRELLSAVDLADEALATSGNYRNFYEADGKKYWHTLDPRTGLPARSSVLQASVKAKTCAEADAIATAMMVLGEEGLKLAEEQGWSVMLVFASLGSDIEIRATGDLREAADELATAQVPAQ
ncbi:MAG: hypothetical protein Aurels2KO_22580 [Aureliella sp.]